MGGYNLIMKTNKTWHEKHRETRSWGAIIADSVASFVGSWPFVIIHIVWFSVWILLSIEKFPYGLLTMIVSLEAILLSTFLMMAQNRQSERDRTQANEDYETNIEAKKEIEALQIKLNKIETEKLDVILKILEKK